jgi:hypothetical protein
MSGRSRRRLVVETEITLRQRPAGSSVPSRRWWDTSTTDVIADCRQTRQYATSVRMAVAMRSGLGMNHSSRTWL